MSPSLIQCFKFLAFVCDSTGRFESDLSKTLCNRYSQITAHIFSPFHISVSVVRVLATDSEVEPTEREQTEPSDIDIRCAFNFLIVNYVA